MPGHKVTIVPVKDNQWLGRCSCRATGKITADHWEATKWTMKHLAEIERVRIHASGTPSMKDQRDYYRERAGDEGLDEHERALWSQLADELDHRLGDVGPRPEQPQLFEEPL